ncbi:MAG: aminopeptidase [Spirochaetaceae bacterium]|nr:aminopeptidase [Spirochaetaceae bacterium]
MGYTDEETEGKTEGQRLAEKLCINKKNCWDAVRPEDAERVRSFAADYAAFLDRGKTERECAAASVEALVQAGFQDIEAIPPESGPLVPGAKVYLNNRGKSLAFAVIGQIPPEEGVNIVGAHIDSPRIDLKTNPLYEEADFALLDTQYYGGIKHYQWTAIPLALHGVMIRRDGTAVAISVGEDAADPVFTITDLLPHLSRDQMQKKLSEAVLGEDLNVLAGSQPFRDAKAKDKVKLNILNLLHERYGVVEQDFARAELELVPAFKARDLGFDRSMIGAYGHDDRSCAYAALRAVLELAGSETPPPKTVVCIFTDKEETGSAGNTGAQSRLFENFIAYLLSKGKTAYSDLTLRRALGRSAMLSADVNAAFDPTFDSAYDRKTASYCGRGIVLCKYTGSGGKVGGSDAGAEFCGKVQLLLDRNTIQWQYGAFGKVDKGGGGTIAKHVANLGVEVLDCGIPVLSMHSPFEVISKIDLYTTCRGYAAFLRDMR